MFVIMRKGMKASPVPRPLVFIQMWVSMTEVASDRLQAEDKRQWMTEEKLKGYRDLVQSSGLLADVDAVVDGEKLVFFFVLAWSRFEGEEIKQTLCYVLI